MSQPIQTNVVCSLGIEVERGPFVREKHLGFLLPSDEGTTLETLDFAFRLSAVYQPFIFGYKKSNLQENGTC